MRAAAILPVFALKKNFEFGRKPPMHILDIFKAHPTTFSFEFFPPKTDEASEELFANIARLQELQPSFVSVIAEIRRLASSDDAALSRMQ